jgi:RNA recognition motif-containing protein
MSVRVFVGNLAYDVTEAELKEFFAPAGAPLSVRMPTDRETGKPRGFAFVEFSEAAQADEAVRRFHQQVFKGRPLVVNEARPREEGAGPRSSAPGQFGRPSAPGAPERAGRSVRTRRAAVRENPKATAPKESERPRGLSASAPEGSSSPELWTIPRAIRGRTMSPSGRAPNWRTKTRSDARARNLGSSDGRLPQGGREESASGAM